MPWLGEGHRAPRYLQHHVGAQRGPSDAVALSVGGQRGLEGEPELSVLLPGVAELPTVVPAAVPRWGRLSGRHAAHRDHRHRPPRRQRPQQQGTPPPLPQHPAAVAPQHPLLQGLLQRLPRDDADGHGKEDGHAEAADSTFPGLRHLPEARGPSCVGDLAGGAGKRHGAIAVGCSSSSSTPLLQQHKKENPLLGLLQNNIKKTKQKI